MSDDKRDLTRIEDLSEFIHELNAEDDDAFNEDVPSELPGIPMSDAGSFGTTFETSNDEESDDPFSTFETTNEEFSSGFGDEFSTTSSPDETAIFKTNDFGTSFENDLEDEKIEDKQEEADSDDEAFDTSWMTEDNSEQDISEEPKIDSFFDKETEVTSAPLYTPQETYKSPETFEDLKKFSESSSFTGMATEGNPSFSVLLKNVRYIEDVNDIILLLKELSLLTDSEDQMRTRLMRGMLLVPRVSEFAAIFLAHKLRRFDIDIQVGLSDEIHPPKHQEGPETGVVSKYNLYQNQSHHFHFDDPKLELSQIIVSATPGLEGHQVLRYIGVASEHKMLDSHVVEDENSDDVPKHYQELAQKLKAHALKAHANAVVGLNYQLTPIPSEFGMGGHKYRLTCTGNLVWVNKL